MFLSFHTFYASKKISTQLCIFSEEETSRTSLFCGGVFCFCLVFWHEGSWIWSCITHTHSPRYIPLYDNSGYLGFWMSADVSSRYRKDDRSSGTYRRGGSGDICLWGESQSSIHFGQEDLSRNTRCDRADALWSEYGFFLSDSECGLTLWYTRSACDHPDWWRKYHMNSILLYCKNIQKQNIYPRWYRNSHMMTDAPVIWSERISDLQAIWWQTCDLSAW